LAQKFGEQKLVRGYSASGILLDGAAISQKGLDRRAIEEEVRRAVLQEPGVAAAFTRSELENPASLPTGTPVPRAGAQDVEPRALRRRANADPELLAVRIAPRVRGDARLAVRQDYTVPILFYGPRWLGAGRVDQSVEVADIAPTLARLLGVPRLRPPKESTPLPAPR
jgi:hypothetical protein